MIPNNPLAKEVQIINRELAIVKNVFLGTLNLVSAFDITNQKLLPYGLRAHTRSVSWIAEQVITQQTKYHAKKLGISDVEIDMPDTCLHDCVIIIGENRYFVNVKMHNADGRHTRNDISAVEKLYMQYNANENYRLIYAVFGIRFKNINISFVKQDVHVFSPQFLPIYVNPRNDKIQALYNHQPVTRTREDFLRLLRDNSRSIVLE